ncbi:MAG: hypothetical protein AAFU59_16675 [Pseudomonadota bacterium]
MALLKKKPQREKTARVTFHVPEELSAAFHDVRSKAKAAGFEVDEAINAEAVKFLRSLTDRMQRDIEEDAQVSGAAPDITSQPAGDAPLPSDRPALAAAELD